MAQPAEIRQFFDLVHFTILGVRRKTGWRARWTDCPLIAFPTRELFMEKIEDFDLIIF